MVGASISAYKFLAPEGIVTFNSLVAVPEVASAFWLIVRGALSVVAGAATKFNVTSFAASGITTGSSVVISFVKFTVVATSPTLARAWFTAATVEASTVAVV